MLQTNFIAVVGAEVILSNINSGCIGINITRNQDTASAFVPTINRGRETALPCPLYHSGAAGIDIKFHPLPPNLTMLNRNEIISGLALAFAAFTYAFVLFNILPFKNYNYEMPMRAIAMAIVLTVAMNWLLSASLLTGWSWVAALFACQVVLVSFSSFLFLGDGLFLAAFLWAGIMIVGVTSVYTNFSQQKTLLIVGLCTVFFIASMYLSLIGGYMLKGKNPFEGSSKQMQPLLNQKVEIRTDNPKQLYLNGKTGKLTHINRYEVTVQLDSGGDETLMWPHVDVWWQDVKAASEQKSQ